MKSNCSTWFSLPRLSHSCDVASMGTVLALARDHPVSLHTGACVLSSPTNTQHHIISHQIWALGTRPSNYQTSSSHGIQSDPFNCNNQQHQCVPFLHIVSGVKTRVVSQCFNTPSALVNNNYYVCARLICLATTNTTSQWPGASPLSVSASPFYICNLCFQK